MSTDSEVTGPDKEKRHLQSKLSREPSVLETKTREKSQQVDRLIQAEAMETGKVIFKDNTFTSCCNFQKQHIYVLL